MRPGPMEIAIIIVVIIVAAMITRILRTRQAASRQDKESPAGQPARQVKGKAGSTRHSLTRTGITLILAGGILLLAGITFFRWAFQTYSWAFVIIAIGIVMTFLSRKR